jgi:hypothetical protein
MNGFALATDETQAVVALGDSLGYRATALAAEFHAGFPVGCAYLGGMCHASQARFRADKGLGGERLWCMMQGRP